MLSLITRRSTAHLTYSTCASSLPPSKEPEHGSFVFARKKSELEEVLVRRRIGIAAVVLSALSAPVAFAHSSSFTGNAVYYSDRYAGQGMACGGDYQPHKMVAAHRTLDCGTVLRVENLGNGRAVTVTVLDRGPYSDGDVLDVSRRAAEELDFVSQGRTLVRATIVQDEAASDEDEAAQNKDDRAKDQDDRAKGQDESARKRDKALRNEDIPKLNQEESESDEDEDELTSRPDWLHVP